MPTPVANFTAAPVVGSPNTVVTFTDTSTNTPTSWSWTFGDGGTSTSQSPTHAYTTPGVYTVALQATNVSGSNTKTSANLISISVPGSSVERVFGEVKFGILRPRRRLR